MSGFTSSSAVYHHDDLRPAVHTTKLITVYFSPVFYLFLLVLNEVLPFVACCVPTEYKWEMRLFVVVVVVVVDSKCLHRLWMIFLCL